MRALEPVSSLRQQSVQGGGWAVLGAAGSSGISFISFLVLSRLLGPSDFGLMAMVETALALGQRLMAGGLSEPLIQMTKLDEEDADTLFWTLQALGIFLTGLAISMGGLAGEFFSEKGLPPLLAATAVTLYLQALSLVPGALLARRFQFSATAKATLISELAGGVAGISWVLLGHGVWGLVLQRVVAAGINTAMLWAKARWRPRLRWSGQSFDRVWRFSASRGLESLLLFVDQQAPRIILGRFAGANELGQFVFARRIVENTVTLLNNPLRTAALSTFSAIQDDLGRVRRTYAEGVALTTTVVIPASVGIALVAPLLVPLLVGNSWQPSVILLQILVLAALRTPFHVWNAAIMRGLGQPQLLMLATLVRSTATVIFVFAALPWGGPGVCLAILASSWLTWPLALSFVRKVAGFGAWEQLQPGRTSILATLIMCCAVMGLQAMVRDRIPAVGAALASIAVGIAVYFASMFWLGPDDLRSLMRNVRVLRGREPK